MRKELLAVAEANGGPFTRAQAIRSGYTAWMIRERCRRGRWVILRYGVYVEKVLYDACRTDSRRWEELRVATAVLALGRENLVAGSHQSAAIVHGIALLAAPSQDVTVTRMPDSPCHRRKYPGIHVYPAALSREHIIVDRGVRITNPARTVIDLCRALSFREGVVTADSALHTKKCTRRDLVRVIDDCSGWPGRNRAIAAVDFSDEKARTPLESIARVMCAEQGLPPPETGTYFGDPDEPFTEVDLYWRRYRTIVLVDGLSKYDSDPATNRQEKLKQERLEEMGYVVIRLTWEDILRRPAQCAQRIRAGFERAIRAHAQSAQRHGIEGAA